MFNTYYFETFLKSATGKAAMGAVGAVWVTFVACR
jgi:hypothetical protein